MKRWALIFALLAPGCLDGEGVPDARVYQDDLDGDTSTHPGFRDASCPGGDTSGASGGGCPGDGGTGGVAIDAGVPDAALPDAGPPCDEVTFSHQTHFDFESLWVFGSFTEPEPWAEHPDDGALVMEHLGDGLWELTARIGPGYHEYKFLPDGNVDGSFYDPTYPDTDDGHGGRNNFIVLCE